MPYFRHDNLRFYFEEHGSGIPFVFSHGLSGSVEQSRALTGTEAGCRLILYDNRGHGRTVEPGPLEQLTFSTMAADVAALIDHLSITKAVIGGVSMGAGVALAFCLAYPHRTQAMVLVRPAWLNQSEPPNLAMFPAIAALIKVHGAETARRLFLSSTMFARWKEQYPQAEASVDGIFSGPSAEAMSATFQEVPRSTPWTGPMEKLAGIHMPVLVLGNRPDPMHPIDYAEAIAKSIPAAQFREIPAKSEGAERHAAAFRFQLREFLRANSQLQEGPAGDGR